MVVAENIPYVDMVSHSLVTSCSSSACLRISRKYCSPSSSTASCNFLGRPKPLLFSLKLQCSRSRQCRISGKTLLIQPIVAPSALPRHICICIWAMSSYYKRAMVSTLCRSLNWFITSNTARARFKGHSTFII